MIKNNVDTYQQKASKDAGLKFLITIITTILKWVWFLIKGENDRKTNKIEMFWDMISTGFDKQVPFSVNTLDKIRKHLKSGDVVLDYGCATGAVAIEIAGDVKEIYGIDISSKMIEAAKTRATERKIENVDFVYSTIFDKRLKRESFDVILSLNILHLLEDTRKVTERISELLKPGGLFISETVCQGERKTFLRFLLFLLCKAGILPPIRFLKTSELEDLITSKNVHIIETDNFYEHYERKHFVVAKKINA